MNLVARDLPEETAVVVGDCGMYCVTVDDGLLSLVGPYLAICEEGPGTWSMWRERVILRTAARPRETDANKIGA